MTVSDFSDKPCSFESNLRSSSSFPPCNQSVLALQRSFVETADLRRCLLSHKVSAKMTPCHENTPVHKETTCPWSTRMPRLYTPRVARLSQYTPATAERLRNEFPKPDSHHACFSRNRLPLRKMTILKSLFGLTCALVLTSLLVSKRPGHVHCSNHVIGNDSSRAARAGHVTRPGLRTEAETPCPDQPLDIRVNATFRLQYVPRCHGNVTLLPEKVNRTWLPSLNFGDPCLKRLIRKYCSDGLPVPNIVHHVWFGPRQFKLDHFLSFLSVKFQAPCLVLVHADVLPSGPLWEFYLQQQQRVLHVHRSRPLSIHGNRITRVEHMADIARLEAVREYGGIYMDTDTVLLRSLDNFRFLQMTLSFEGAGALSNALIVAAPNTSFLTLWHAAYKTFQAKEWGAHSVAKPAELAVQHPTLITTLYQKFIGPGWQRMGLYNEEGRLYDWSADFALHLYTRMDSRQHLYNISSVLWINNTVASVARHVLYARTKPCPHL